MSPCENLPELAPDYHSGALTAPEAARYEAHLSSCATCRSADEQYRQGLELLLPWPAEPSKVSDADFLAKLLAATQEAKSRALPTTVAGEVARPVLAVVPRDDQRTGRKRIAWAPVALAASILILIAGLSWREGHSPVSLPVTEEMVEGEGSPLAWADLSGLEESLLADQSGLVELAGLDEDSYLDPALLEEEVWFEIAPEESAFEEAWPSAGPALEDEINQLDVNQKAHLMELFEQG